jgi:hypothetical protein
MADEEGLPELHIDVNPEWLVSSMEAGAENEATLGRLKSIFGPGNDWMSEPQMVRAMGVTHDEFNRFDAHRWLEHDGMGKYRINPELLDEG